MLCSCKQLRSSEWVGNASFYVWPVTVAKADIQKRKLQGVLSYRRMIRISVTQKVSDVKVTPTRQETRTKLGRVRRRNNIPIRTYVMVHTGVNEYRQRWTSLSLGSKQGDIRWADCLLKVGQLMGTFKSGFSRLMNLRILFKKKKTNKNYQFWKCAFKAFFTLDFAQYISKTIPTIQKPSRQYYLILFVFSKFEIS